MIIYFGEDEKTRKVAVFRFLCCYPQILISDFRFLPEPEDGIIRHLVTNLSKRLCLSHQLIVPRRPSFEQLYPMIMRKDILMADFDQRDLNGYIMIIKNLQIKVLCSPKNNSSWIDPV